MASFTDIPVVSMADWRGSPAGQQAFADELRRICHEVGFFLVVDHGIDQADIDAHFARMQAFFDLPTATKELIDKRHSRHFRGWERVGAELTGNRVDWREQIDINTEYEALPIGVEPDYLHLYGPNQWLDDGLLPGFRAGVTSMVARLAGVADELMAAICRSVGLPEDHLRALFGAQPMSLTKLISYPPTPPGEAGVNAHHDTGFLTLLLQHGVAGLQAQNPDGAWVDVPPTLGSIVVNLGETLQSLSGNYFVATTHRVIASEARLSCGYFHQPDLRTRLDPLPLDPAYAAAVAASPRHAGAGFMARREQLLDGTEGIGSATTASVFGSLIWNYYVRSYPDLVRSHYPDDARVSDHGPRES